MGAGVVFALLSSMAFGFNGASVRRGVASAAASQGLYITLFLGTIMFVPAALISGQMFQLGRITGHDYGIMAWQASFTSSLGATATIALSRRWERTGRSPSWALRRSGPC